MTASPKTFSERRALILDFDGVIVETEKLHFDCWNAAFRERFNIEVSGSHHQIVGLSLSEIYALWRNVRIDEPLQLTPQIEQELLARKTELYYELGQWTLEPIPGAVEIIRWAQTYDWYVTIASRGRRMRLIRTLGMLKMPVYVDMIMGTEDVVDAEIDKKVHTRTVAAFGIAPANTIVIEDSESGVSSAKACQPGMVIGLTTSVTHDALLNAGADVVVDSLEEAIALLQQQFGKSH